MLESLRKVGLSGEAALESRIIDDRQRIEIKGNQRRDVLRSARSGLSRRLAHAKRWFQSDHRAVDPLMIQLQEPPLPLDRARCGRPRADGEPAGLELRKPPEPIGQPLGRLSQRDRADNRIAHRLFQIERTLRLADPQRLDVAGKLRHQPPRRNAERRR